eukprot:TRINITY_DN2297_c0_g1_i1.p1 TRINITY_DN2297_c0_g1~~TRINITY_DN2297_c0_g1_i1.p1  ORF type:complete len:1157 (-),score=394.46 TRINITY_DN2297_c0_g1_i1:193-3663(-)
MCIRDSNIIGGDVDPEGNAPATLRYKIFDQHEALGMEGPTDEVEFGVYASRSAIQAISDRIAYLTPFEKSKDPDFNLMSAVQEDVFGKVLAEEGGINALSLLERYLRDVYHSRSKSNVFTMLDLMGSEECLTIIESEGETFLDIVSPAKGMGARRSTMRVTGEAPDSDEVFVDQDFRDAHRDVEEWKRIGDIYPEPEDGELLPSFPLVTMFSQGTNTDCSVLSAFAILCRMPKVLENIFVSKETRKDGMYTFQFYRGDMWVKIEVDDAVPMWRGNIANCCSPTKHWWPLLLEKAYAKLYGGYYAISGSSMSEIIHALSSKPVLNYVLRQEFVDQGVIPDYRQASWWVQQGDRIRSDSVVLAVPASRSDGADGLPSRSDAEALGLEPGHGYGVIDILSTLEEGEEPDSLDQVLLKVHNPFNVLRYNGPYTKASDFSDELLERLELTDSYKMGETDSIFYVPVSTILEASRTVTQGQIDAVEPHPYVLSGNWTLATAGGPPTCTSWRSNPIYTVKNMADRPISCMVVLKQPDQRVNSLDGSGSAGDFTYKQCGITVVQHTDPDLESMETTYLTNNIFKPIHRGVFLNQRDVTDNVTFPANSTCYIVPSTFEAGEQTKFLLAVYIPAQTRHKEFLVRLPELEVDTLFPNHVQLSLEPKKKVFTDIVVRKPTQLHCLLVQHKDKSMTDDSAPDLTSETYVAMMVYDENDAKIASMSSGVNYKETGLLLELPAAGRYHVMATCLKGAETSECTLFLSTNPEAEAVIGQHRKLAEEEDLYEDWKEQDAERQEKKAAAAEAARKKKEKADAEAKKKADEEAEKLRVAEEAERKKKEKAEAEAKRKEDEEAERQQKAEEAERKRKEKAEAEAKRKEEEEAERKRKEEEYDIKKKEKAEAEAKRKEEEDAERKRKEEEAVQRRKEKQDAEAEKRDADEAERKRKEAERLEAKQAAEEEASRLQKEKDADMEKKRQLKAESDAAKKAAEEAERAEKAEEAERKRKEKAEADAQQKEEDDAKRAADEAKRKAKKDAEAAKKAEDEEAKKRELEERAEKRRLEKEEKDKNRVSKPPNSPRAKPNTSPSSNKSKRTTSVSAPKSRKSSGKEHYFQPTAASRGHRTSLQANVEAFTLPPIHKTGFGSSSPRNLGKYEILPYIRKYEENIF